jgi:hypothetical protein
MTQQPTTLFTDERLLALNAQGLIPGPQESEEAFFKRTEYCLHLPEHLAVPLHNGILDGPNQEMKHLYDIVIDWVPVIFSNERLAPWHGGCSWIFQYAETTPTAALMQLRQIFRHQQSYLRICDRDELLRHELVHVGRMKFEEPRFEEMFAYASSTSAFRRWFGPLVQASWEAVVFLMILAAIFIFDIFLMIFGHGDAWELSWLLKLVPLALVVMALVRLGFRHRSYSRCLSRLEACLDCGRKARAVAYRLSDKEIAAFGSFTNEQVRAYAHLQAREELRWRVISLAYF